MIVLRCLLFVWLLCVQTCHSQNLILNPSFEIGSTTLSYEGKLATSWQKECGQHVYIRSGNDAWGGLRTTAGSYYLGFQGKGACNGLMQTINITANAQVTITFSTACRPGYGLLRLDVFMDSTKLGEFGLSNSYFVSSQVIVQASNVSRAGVLRFQNTPTSCTDCTSFFDNFSAVTSCSIGYYLDGVRCTSCPDGKYGSAAGKASAEEACTSCVAAGSATACEVCAAGWDGVTCAACAVGKFKIWQGNDVACTECTGWSGAYAGYADSAGQSSCTPCPAHASNCSPSDKGTCNAGYGGSTADGSCTACAIGKFKAEAGNAACTTCGSIRIGCGPPAVVSIINARHASNENIVPTSSVGIPDLSGTAGMVWKVESGTIPFETVDGIPCWNMNAGNLITSTQKRLGDSYTLFYYWKPRVSDSGWRTLHRGTVSAHTYACMKYGSCVS